MSYRIGVDVGGTFTDVVAISDAGITTVVKAPTTTDDQSRGVLDGILDLASRLGLDLATLLSQTTQIVHGTTVATNALLERKGAKLGLLTTEGHRDILEMHEGLKPDRYNLRMAPMAPLVPRERRLGIPERIGQDGQVITPLDEAAVIDALDRFRAEGVEAIAICYLHSYRNPAHEARTAQLVAEHLPGVYCSTSEQVLPQIKEYERFSTTVVNAYVGPALQKYLSRLETRLTEAGFGGDLFVILSHGGIVRVADAIRLGAATVLSGPAGGITGAKMVARIMGLPHVLPFDMGGTSTEIALVVDGDTALSAERGVGGTRVALRAFDILSIGAGGGSLARVDASGRFDVGPQSAGAWPGPVCYARGGQEITVTDANLMLGYLDPEGFRGGRAQLDVASTAEAMGRLGSALGTTTLAAAEGVFRLINVKMADGFRLMTIRRGVDPRNFALLGFGGAAGIHATSIARELGVKRVIVPEMASVLSAWGMLASDLRYELGRSCLADTASLQDDTLRALIHDLTQEAENRCGFAGMPDRPLSFELSAEMRYGDQIFEVDVPLTGLDIAADGLVARVEARFHARHEELFTYASPDHPVEVVNLRVAAVAKASSRFKAERVWDDAAPAAPSGYREASIEGARLMVALYAMTDLRPGQEIAGPALIEAENTTVLLGQGDLCRVTDLGWLDISVSLPS